MADLKTMFSKLTNGTTTTADVQPLPASKKAATIEEIYQKKSQYEHILLRPDTYIGSIEKLTEEMWIYDSEKEMMVKKEITYVPGLYKIFDEILVNAADNKQRDKQMDCIKIEIRPEENLISVWNNGQGIPIQMHKVEKMYVPTMIFGHLLTSSNYNDEEEKVTGGRNGYGAKLCNIFSNKFIVETASKQAKKQFKQTWATNMTKTSEPKIRESSGEDYTKITFYPDLAKFKMDKLDDDIVSLMTRRAYDVAASSRGVKVILNGRTLPVKTFKDYVNLYIKGKKDDSDNDLKIVYEQAGERWEVAITLSDGTFNQMSFVNSIATTKGGRHVDHVVDMIIKYLLEIFKKKHKDSTVNKAQIKNRLWVFVNCLIVNPNFDSQTKENMTLQARSFGSKCTLTDKFFKSVAKVGIVEAVLSWITFQQEKQAMAKGGSKKVRKLKGITKLEEAVKVAGPESYKCTLILTEGDSAKSLAMSGLGVIGRDYYGVFPLRGKLLNVREASLKQEQENSEIQDLIKIIGLQKFKKYNTSESLKSLRYGKVMIMTDQDQDGSHIKGLLINFIHYHWPDLLRQNFLEEFITPIVKARKKKQVLSFYSLPEFEEWRQNTPNNHTYEIKYYKGLGTSTSEEAKEYFSDMARHRIPFRYSGPEDDDHIVLAFSKKHADARKEWLTNFMLDSKRRKELGMPDRYLYTKELKYINYKDFVNLELVLFSNADNIRSIPSLVDGFKPGQRKVIFTCFKRNDKREVKVAQLSGSVAEHSAYHHGEVSLCMTIVNLAQNFVGSNNINLLEPRGQFGTRLSGGKDAASPRYIFTKLSPLARMIFHPSDDPLLKHEYDDNLKIEPVWYIPIIPMVLVNGAEGIGTGWMTKILNYNPRDIVECIRTMLDGGEPKELIPWYKNFKGTIEYCGEGRYCISGEIAIIGPNQVEITELPIGTWTQNYKENVLEPMVNGSPKIKAVLNDYREYNTDTVIKYIVQLQNGQMEILENEGLHKAFKLQTIANTSSMCAFDELGCLKKFNSVMDILHEFYPLRLKMYQKRKDYLEGMLEAEAKKLTNQARFIMEKCSGKITVENKKRKTIIDELFSKGYDVDPVLEWKERVSDGDDETEASQDDDERNEDGEDGEGTSRPTGKPSGKDAKILTDSKKFDYLLGMSMWMLTDEKKNELLKQREDKLNELEILRKRSTTDLWREDLDKFMIQLDEIEAKEREKEAAGGAKKTLKKEGKKKIKLAEILPSPLAKRVVPTITEEIKKKIQAAVKLKENKIKKGMKKDIDNGNEEFDEFDAMVKNQKTLKEKIGTPEDVEKNVKKKKGTDGLKQTKLTFKKKTGADGDTNKQTKKGKAKKKDSFTISDSEDDFDADNGFDDEISPPPVKERTNAKRAATKIQKYNFSDDDDKMDDNWSDKDEELQENDFLKKADHKAQQVIISDSDEEKSPPPRLDSSEDLFDNLIGNKNEKKPEENGIKRKLPASQSSSDDEQVKSKKKEKPKKPRAKKQKKTSGSDNDDDDIVYNKKAQSKTKKKTTNRVDDYDDDDSPIKRPPAATHRTRPGRGGAAKATYVFDSDSE